MKCIFYIFIILLSFILGCGQRVVPSRAVPALAPAKQATRLVKVEGLVTLDGQSLRGGMVMFLPETEAEGRPASGSIDEQGTFELGTLAPRDGVVPGTYKVVVTPREGGQEAKPDLSTKPIPVKYTDPEKTPLKCTVEQEGQKVRLELAS